MTNELLAVVAFFLVMIFGKFNKNQEESCDGSLTSNLFQEAEFGIFLRNIIMTKAKMLKA